MAAIYVLLIIFLSTAVAAMVGAPGRPVTRGVNPNRSFAPDAYGATRVQAARKAKR